MAKKIKSAVAPNGMTIQYNARDKFDGRDIAYFQIDSIPEDVFNKFKDIVYIKRGGSYFQRGGDTLTPQMFGAKGDGVADDIIPLRLWGDFIMSNYYYQPVIRGRFRITGNWTLLATTFVSRTFMSSCEIIADFTSEEEVVRLQNWNYGYIKGSLVVTGGGPSAWASRRNGTGIYIEGCSRLKADFLHVSRFKYYGIFNISPSSLTTFGVVKTSQCGSGNLATTELKLTIKSIEHIGSGNSGNQYTRLGIAEPLPSGFKSQEAFIMPTGFGHESPYFARVVGADYIDVFPWVNQDVSVGSTVSAFIGAGFRCEGGDSSCINIVKLDASNCSTGLWNASLYPASVETFVCQSNGVGLALGRDISSAFDGGQMAYGYFESNGYDIVKVTRSTGANVNYKIGALTTLRLDKVYALSPKPSLAAPYSGQFGTIDGIDINRDTVYTHNYGRGFEPTTSARTVTPSPTPVSIYNFRKDSLDFTLVDDIHRHRLYGYRSMYLCVQGTGVNGSSTGNYSFNSALPVNGLAAGTPFVFNGIKSTTLFYCYTDGAQWFVSKVGADQVNATPLIKGVVNQSAPVPDVTAAEAIDLATALNLVNELKLRLNAKLNADRISGQQSL